VPVKLNKLVHYIWVGNGNIPAHFMSNYKKTKQLNPDYKFQIWTEEDIIPLLGEYENTFNNASLFHKLQFGRYLILNHCGGICCDFDIEWKENFNNIYNLFKEKDLVFIKRNSLYFYNKDKKTSLLDDYIILAKPELTKSFLEFCMTRTDLKQDKTEPISVYALTEWCLGKNIGYINDNDSNMFYHENKKTWLLTNM
jgi:hypothetical protein